VDSQPDGTQPDGTQPDGTKAEILATAKAKAKDEAEAEAKPETGGLRGSGQYPSYSLKVFPPSAIRHLHLDTLQKYLVIESK